MDDTKRRDPHAGGVCFCYVGKDAVAAENLIKSALENEFGINLPKSKRPKAGSVKLIEKAAIIIQSGEKGEEIAAVLKGFCKKYWVEPVPVYKFVGCLSPDTPKTVIAFEFSKKQREFFPPGFTLIFLRELISSGKVKGLNTFEEIKEVASGLF